MNRPAHHGLTLRIRTFRNICHILGYARAIKRRTRLDPRSRVEVVECISHCLDDLPQLPDLSRRQVVNLNMLHPSSRSGKSAAHATGEPSPRTFSAIASILWKAKISCHNSPRPIEKMSPQPLHSPIEAPQTGPCAEPGSNDCQECQGQPR
jgi:hypothetical protein